MPTPTRDAAASHASPPLPPAVESVRRALGEVRRPLWLVAREGDPAIEVADAAPAPAAGLRAAFLPAIAPEALGDPSFGAAHGVRWPVVAGAMANGIASEALVASMARRGLLAFFGAAGLDPSRVLAAVDRLSSDLGPLPFGVNLIHSPGEPWLEDALVDLFLDRRVPLVEASAFMEITPALVRYRCAGLRRDPSGRVAAPHRVVAKVSRVEVATRFLSPPPERLLRPLVEAGRLSAEEATLAGEIPVATDLTAEADSGGHTDNRPLVALLPSLLALRDRLQERFGYAEPVRVGAAGGIATPAAAAAAFAMGAAYAVTGSVNQACVESGSSDAVREMLAAAEQADTTMAPAADMFEMGVRVQVLKRGTMFPMRAAKLYELWRTRAGLDDLPADERASLEKVVFRAPLEEIWRQTRDYFLARDPAQVERAEADPRHRMALVFRWYLAWSSRWANAGEPSRRIDYQVWCGPSMGAFNEWARGSFLEDWRARSAPVVNLNLLLGAATALRVSTARAQGIPVPPAAAAHHPLPLEELLERLG